MKSLLLSVVGVGAFGTFAVCDLCQTPAGVLPVEPGVAAAAAAPAGAAAFELKQVTFNVDGMTCGGCAIATRTVLERLDGVEKAKVSHEESRAVVTYDPVTVTVERMIAAIEELGYKARVVEPVDK